ncbi:MAG: hypothetical protein RL514_2940 [Verrucomicrobiota bacterium]
MEQTFTIPVLDVNEAPVAANDSDTLNQGDRLTLTATGGVLANDTDPDQDALTATLVATTARGSLRLNPNGSLTYTPDSSFFGTDAFTYRASGGTPIFNPPDQPLRAKGQRAEQHAVRLHRAAHRSQAK